VVRLVGSAILGMLMLMLSCAFDEIDLVGKRCTEQRPCGRGLICVDGVCESSLSGPSSRNLIFNAGFESGGVGNGWEFNNGTLVTEVTQPRTGTAAARLSLLPGETNMAIYPAEDVVPNTLAGVTYCGSVWAQGTNGLILSLGVRERTLSGDSFIATSYQRITLQEGTWTQASPAGLTTVGGGRLDIRFFTPEGVTATPGSYFIVDDFNLIRSQDGGCD